MTNPIDDSRRLLSEVDYVAFAVVANGPAQAECGAVRFTLGNVQNDAFQGFVLDTSAASGANPTSNQQPSEALSGFLAYLDQPGGVLLCHDAAKAIAVLSHSALADGLQLPSCPVVDTLRLCRVCLPRVRPPTLQNVAANLRLAAASDNHALSQARLVMAILRQLAQRVVTLRTVSDLWRLSPPSSFGARLEARAAPSGIHERLKHCIAQQQSIILEYEAKTSGHIERKVLPRGFMQFNGQTYLTAFCHTAGQDKSFRLDRIRGFRVADGPAS